MARCSVLICRRFHMFCAAGMQSSSRMRRTSSNMFGRVATHGVAGQSVGGDVAPGRQVRRGASRALVVFGSDNGGAQWGEGAEMSLRNGPVKNAAQQAGCHRTGTTRDRTRAAGCGAPFFSFPLLDQGCGCHGDFLGWLSSVHWQVHDGVGGGTGEMRAVG